VNARWCVVVTLASALTASACMVPPVVSTGVPGGGASPGRSPGDRISCALPSGAADFATAAPGAVGLDPAAVQRAVAYASDRGAESVRVYRHDCLVAASGLDAQYADQPLEGWSATKGVVSIAVGRAVALGLLAVDDPVGRYLPGLPADHAAITVRQFLTQTSGLRMAWANDLWAASATDSVADVLARPLEARPGERFLYAQTAVSVLPAVVAAAAHEDFRSFVRRELFEPLGITDREWSWAHDPAGNTQGFAFLRLAPVGWARLGELLLHEGRWGDRRLLPAEYVRGGAEGTAVNPAYGFLWWTNHGDTQLTAGFPDYERIDHRLWTALPPDAFGLSGLFGQDITVIPSLDMVLVRMGLPAELIMDPFGEPHGHRPPWDHRYHRMLMAGVLDARVADPGDWVWGGDDPPLDLFHIVEPGLPPFNGPSFARLGVGPHPPVVRPSPPPAAVGPLPSPAASGWPWAPAVVPLAIVGG